MKEDQVHWQKTASPMKEFQTSRESVDNKDYFKQIKKIDVSDKVTNINHYIEKDFDLYQYKAFNGRNTRWSEDEHRKRFGKVFENPLLGNQTTEP